MVMDASFYLLGARPQKRETPIGLAGNRLIEMIVSLYEVCYVQNL